MKLLSLLSILSVVVLAQEVNLDNLLKKYQNSESLYKKTQQENAGFLISYSREDLEQMQAYKLKDILKTVRMFNLLMSPIGSTTIEKASTNNNNMNQIKLFIDDFEVTSLMQSNPIELYIDMNLYFVDHIEIYQGGSSIAFGNEPGNMVIRLYSKNPCRENSSSIEASINSYGGNIVKFIDAGKIGKYEYLGYANIENTKDKKYTLNNKNLSKDFNNYQTHFKFEEKNNFQLEFDSIFNKSDAFKGIANHPLNNNEIQRQYAYLSFTKYFKNDLKLSFSLSREYKKADIKDEIGFITANNENSKMFYTNTNSKIYKAKIEKKYINDKNNILIGTQFIKKELNIKDYKLDHFVPAFDLTKLNIYMFYVEELYNFNKDNLISLSAKIDIYKDNVNKSDTQYSSRLAYIRMISDNLKSKIFLIRRYLYPNGMQTSFSMPTYKPNPKLKSFPLENIAGELEYNKDKKRFVFGLANMDIFGPIIFDKVNKMYVNSNTNISYQRVYLRTEYKFDIDNKAVIEYFKMYKSKYMSSGSGLLVQSFNKIGKFDIYNELTFRDGYDINNIKIDSGYDWTMGITYPIDKKTTLKFKGENLLDSSIEVLIDPATLLEVPVYERKFIMTMEYTF